MAEEEKKKSFWETLPGIITAIAALITAIAALVAAMNGVSKEKPEAPAAAAPPQIFAPPANDEAARRAAGSRCGSIGMSLLKIRQTK